MTSIRLDSWTSTKVRSARKNIHYQELSIVNRESSYESRFTKLTLFRLQSVELLGQAGFLSGGGLFVHGACRCGLVQLLSDKSELLGCRFDVAFLQDLFKMLDLCFNLALTRPVDCPAFCVLFGSFFCL